MAVLDGVTGAEVSDKDGGGSAALCSALRRSADSYLGLVVGSFHSLFFPECARDHNRCSGAQCRLPTSLQVLELKVHYDQDLCFLWTLLETLVNFENSLQAFVSLWTLSCMISVIALPCVSRFM